MRSSCKSSLSRCLLSLLLLLLASCDGRSTPPASQWSDAELRVLRSLSLSALGDPPPSPSNRFAGDPRAESLGRRLFTDTRLSGNGELSCASCHRAEKHFTDGLPVGVGVAETTRNTPSIVGGAWQTWFYWDGRRDSLWSQALIPIEAPAEMGGSRLAAVRLVALDQEYRAAYEALFGSVPRSLLASRLPRHAGPFAGDEARDAWHRLRPEQRQDINAMYANLGKAIAAWERTVVPRETAFDRYVTTLLAQGDEAAAEHMSEDAIAGARLFIDPARTQCLQCHNGPLLTNGAFHNIGSGRFEGPVLDYGRMFGVQSVLMDEFNCLGPFSDAEPEDCLALRFLSRDPHNPLAGAFKTPSLRNVAATAPYLHDGRYADLAAVVEHYRNPPPADGDAHELQPLDLDDREAAQLVAFLEALSEAPRAPFPGSEAARAWSDSERALLTTLSLDALPAATADRGNAVADDAAAARLGAALFADRGLSRNGEIACTHCHREEHGLADGRALAHGLAPLDRNAPGLLGVAHRRWLYWDGRKDSLWSQALEPIEAAAEMGGDRTRAVRHVVQHPELGPLYRAAFGEPPALDFSVLPVRASPLGGEAERRAWENLTDEERRAVNRVFSNLGKAIAAHELRFVLPATRFDAWTAAIAQGDAEAAARQMNAEEVAGLELFISGRSQCVSCHNGPRFTDGAFHNIGTAPAAGRSQGGRRLAADEFNCRSEYSDDYPNADCAHLDTLLAAEVPAMQAGALRTPGLRNLAATAPYMHDGRFATLDEVLRYYDAPPSHDRGRHELSQAVSFDATQRARLVAFLLTLSEPPR